MSGMVTPIRLLQVDQPPIACIVRAGFTNCAESISWPGPLARTFADDLGGDRLVRSGTTQQRPQIDLVGREQAVAKSSLCGQSDAVAGRAERARQPNR